MKKADRYQKHFGMAVAALICVIAVFAILFSFYIRRFRSTMNDENRTRLEEVSGHISTFMQLMLEEQQNALLTAAEASSEIEDEAQRISFLDRISRQLGFEYIGIAGRDGLLHAAALPEPENISEETYYQKAMDGECAITGLKRHIMSDGVVSGVIFSVPLSQGSEEAVVAMLNISNLEACMNMDSFDGQGYSYIIDQEGEFMLQAKSLEYNNYLQALQNMQFTEGFSLNEVKADIMAQRDGMTSYIDFGIEKYAYYRPLNFNGWMIISTVPKGVIAENTSRLTWELILLCTSAMLVFLCLLITACVLFLRLEQKRQANHARSAFLANMSHDMRTPLNAILGMAAVAESHRREPDTVQDCLKKITYSSKHLLGLINDVLDMSSIDGGGIALTRETFSLPEVLENTLDMVYPAIRSQNQDFSVRLHHVTHEYLIGDSLRLGQIFTNILSNAIKFTQKGGIISVDVEELPRQQENMALFRFTFSDNGIGMNQEFLKHIFLPFSREEDSKVDKIDGSGLGMSITKNMVDQMGGTIEVRSQKGNGTSFYVTLSLPVSPVTPTEPALSCGRVLVVDSDALQGAETIRTLNGLGLPAEWMPGTAAAAERIKRALQGNDPYQAVLLDRSVYEAEGLSAFPSVQLKELPFILAAYSTEDIRGKAQAAGIRCCVQKPLFPSTLRRCLSQTVMHTAEKETETVPDLNGKHILLVEDNALNREIMEDILLEAGATVTSAENGLEGVTLFQNSEEGYFDLILMDVQMPVMNGCQAAKEIRSLQRADDSIPILAMSANAFEEDVKTAKEAGMNSYLMKPIDVDVWMKEIGRYVSGR